MKEFTKSLRPVTRKSFETAKKKALQCAIPVFWDYYGNSYTPSLKNLTVLGYGNVGEMVDYMLFECYVVIGGVEYPHQFEIRFNRDEFKRGWYFVDSFEEVPYRAY